MKLTAETLEGNNKLLYSILSKTIYCSIKVEGIFKDEKGMEEYYADVIEAKKGKIHSYKSYSQYDTDDMAEFYHTNTTMTLRVDNVDVEEVLELFDAEYFAKYSHLKGVH